MKVLISFALATCIFSTEESGNGTGNKSYGRTGSNTIRAPPLHGKATNQGVRFASSGYGGQGSGNGRMIADDYYNQDRTAPEGYPGFDDDVFQPIEPLNEEQGVASNEAYTSGGLNVEQGEQQNKAKKEHKKDTTCCLCICVIAMIIGLIVLAIYYITRQ